MASQIHKRLDAEQVKLILSQYELRMLDRVCAMAQLKTGRSQFFALLAAYRSNPKSFSVRYERTTPKRLSTDVERAIVLELEREKALIEDKAIPIRFYNYSAVRDALLETHGATVSVPTIIARAKQIGCHIPKKDRAVHEREVVTNYVGELVQHDSSHHRWSPLSQEMWYSITSIDDYSRLLLYADMVRRESSWAHIQAAESVFLQYGCPLKYYPDQHSIFRFVERRDAMLQKHTKLTDDIDPQWKQVLTDCNVGVTYALSPQAKGKVERPYRWLQDRTVRRCAKEGAKTFDDTRAIFLSEVERYNLRQVHSTTKEIPLLRFERAIKEGKTMLRPFQVPKPFLSTKDIFCFRTTRTVDAYRKISLQHLVLTVSKVSPRQEVELRVVPDEPNGTTEVRMWFKGTLVGVQTVKYDDLPAVRF